MEMGLMDKERIAQVIISILAIIGLLYGRKISYPDAESILYGLPFNWGTHQLGTIAGPVDYWSVNLSYLALDLVLWLLLIQIIPIIVRRKQVGLR
jgi:hypothetical protein